MIAFVFPGQGSQRRGIGQGLFDEIAQYRDSEAQVDALLGYSLRDLCLRDPERLANTQYTQPALYVVNALHYYKAIGAGVQPSYVAGHSLGEYNALLAAGAFDFMTGLELVHKRGELLAQITNGAMAAVGGLSAKRVEEVLARNDLARIEVANYNTATQIVISGPVADIQKAQLVFENAGAQLYLPLSVSGAFHSRYLAEAAQRFEEFLNRFSFQRLRIPVIANITGQPYPNADPTLVVRSILTQQIIQPVLWSNTIHRLLAAGVTEFHELGPGTVLSSLIKQIRAQSRGSVGAK
jgi:malonyl CoA-acyl carrier protein transacylase